MQFRSGCVNVFLTELNLSMFSSPMQILSQMDTAVKRMEPWKIAVIVVSVIVGLAIVIGLITYFLCHCKCILLLFVF